MDANKQDINDDLQPMLRVLKGMRRAQAPDGMFERVMEQMHRPVARLVPISRVSLAAACLVALVGLNIALLVSKQNAESYSTPVMEYYGTGSEYGYSY